jgi:hypothetical protein
MVGWAVSYAHLWEQAVRSLRQYVLESCRAAAHRCMRD